MIRTTRLVLASVAFGALALLGGGSAHAQGTTPFASFNPGSSPNIAFDSATNLMTSVNQPVSFQFFFPTSLGPGFTTVPATFNLSGLVGNDVNADPSTFSGAVTNFSFSITSGTSNLLSGTGTANLNITGGAGATTGSIAAGDAVNFTSDFIDFSQSQNRNFSFGFSGVTPPVTANGKPASFTATTNGNFAANLPVPEPGSLALVGMALLPVAGLVRARRRK